MAEILQTLLALPEADRWKLVYALLQSLENSPTEIVNQDQQIKAVEGRLTEMESGKVSPISEEEFWNRLRDHQQTKK